MKAEETGETIKKQKTSSIVRTILVRYQMRDLGDTLFMDFLILLTAITCLTVGIELVHGEFVWNAHRAFLLGEPVLADTVRPEYLIRISRLVYEYTPKGGETVQVAIGRPTAYFFAFYNVMLIIQAVDWSLAWIWENGRLRSILKPIDELAVAAERLSSRAWSEAGLKELERSLDEIKRSDARVSLGDKDLAGLENAINNLLTRLQKSYQAQTRFVDDASHELRTPVAVIQGYASMLERWGKEDPQTLEESIHAIRDEADHMKTLIDQLLFLARGDMGRTKLTMEKLNVRELMKEVREESEMIDNSHRYVLDAENEYFCMAEPAMLKQALRILVDNAAKYTKEGGLITLRLRGNEKKVSLEVQDSGIGISQEELPHIFERFFRGEDVRGTTKGSGLGLSIAAWIVDRLGGKISALSIPDYGTRFVIELPRISA